MQTNAHRYIVEINAFEGSEVSVFIQDADGEPLSAHYAIVLVDVQGASIVDSGYRTVAEAKAAWPEAREPGGNHLTPSAADERAIPGAFGGNPSTLERRLPMSENVSLLPIIPCPSCGANILDAGFHNTCTENVKVREDNFTYTKHGRLYLEYKQGDETVDHESDFEAFCGSCNKLLPWPTFAIRCLNGLPLKEATIKAAQLVQSGEISGGNA